MTDKMVARVKEIDEELNRIDDEVDILTKAMDRMYRYRDFLKRKYFYRDTIFLTATAMKF